MESLGHPEHSAHILSPKNSKPPKPFPIISTVLLKRLPSSHLFSDATSLSSSNVLITNGTPFHNFFGYHSTIRMKINSRVTIQYG